MTRRLLFSAVAFVILLVLLAGILLWGAFAESKPKEKTLRIGGVGGIPTVINPLLTKQGISKVLEQLIFNSLIRQNEKGLPMPELAESWDISEDGLTYTFYLRKGVKFHDGVEFTAKDVKFTYEMVRDSDINTFWINCFKCIESLEMVDKYTAKINLKEANSSFLFSLIFHIVPEHLLFSYKDNMKAAPFNRKPIGTGPFKFVEWSYENKIVLEANSDYYEGRPSLDKIIGSGYVTFTQYWMAFVSGDTDVILYLSKENFDTLKYDKRYRTYAFPDAYTYGIEYNFDHDFFKDVKVRKAFAHSINVQNIINKVEAGHGIQSTGPFIPGWWSYNPDIKPLEYNPALSSKLLKESGWELNSECVLEKAGQEFKFTMLLDRQVPNSEKIARLIWEDLHNIGVRVDTKFVDADEIRYGNQSELIENAGTYLTLFIGKRDPVNFIYDWYSKKNKKRNRIWFYQNNELDDLYEQAAKSHKNLEELINQIHAVIYEDQSVAFLYFPYTFCAVNSRFQNTDSFFTPSMPVYTIKDWKID